MRTSIVLFQMEEAFTLVAEMEGRTVACGAGLLIPEHKVCGPVWSGNAFWVSLQRLDALPRHELQDLLRQSYGMVAAKTNVRANPRPKPKSKRRAS